MGMLAKLQEIELLEAELVEKKRSIERKLWFPDNTDYQNRKAWIDDYKGLNFVTSNISSPKDYLEICQWYQKMWGEL